MAEEISKVVIHEEIVRAATIPAMDNLVCLTANKEYKFNLGDPLKFTLKARGGAVKVSFYAGQSNVIYLLLGDGIAYNEDLIHPESFIIYFQSDTVNTVLEIIRWF